MANEDYLWMLRSPGIDIVDVEEIKTRKIAEMRLKEEAFQRLKKLEAKAKEKEAEESASSIIDSLDVNNAS